MTARTTSVLRVSLMTGLAVLAMATSGSASANVLAESQFGTGMDGWQVVDWHGWPGNPPLVESTYTPNWEAAGGNPGGYIWMHDPSDGMFFFSAPSEFLGNKSIAYGGSLSFDVKTDLGDVLNWPSGVIFVGGGVTLVRDNVLQQPSATWTSYSINLATDANWHVNGFYGAQPTESEFEAVLGSLDKLYISGDWANGYDNGSLDGVKMVVPEPASLSLLALGGLALIRRKRA